MSRFTISQTQN